MSVNWSTYMMTVFSPRVSVLNLRTFIGSNLLQRLCTTACENVDVTPPPRVRTRKILYTKGDQKFIDWKKVYVCAGTGGSGCVSFMNARSHKGGPYGGDGGSGGDVTVVANENLTQLSHLKGHYRAGKGGSGKLAWKHGKRGKCVTFEVPVGTTITNMDTGELIVDMSAHEQKHLLVRGGEPGLGNDHFKGPDHVRPREFTDGYPGEELYIEIELKSIADIGLIGFPNAGKSTLLHAISRAKPKVADYPFTTLRPNLGVVQYEKDEHVVVADIPGLVEGAHENRGLGHVFLRHVERCKSLMYVVDVSKVDPLKEFDILKNELDAYKSKLSSLPALFVANKIDLLPTNSDILNEIKNTIEMPVIGISAKNRCNIEELKQRILQHLKTERVGDNQGIEDNQVMENNQGTEGNQGMENNQDIEALPPPN